MNLQRMGNLDEDKMKQILENAKAEEQKIKDMKIFHFVYAFLQIGFLIFETYAKIVPLLYYMIVFMVAGQVFQV